MHDDDLPAGSRGRRAHGSAFYAGGLSVASYDLFVGTELSPLHGEVEFYLSCAGRYGGPVLDLGAGTRRVVWRLAAAGHEVVGLDLSSAMLAIAHGKAAGLSGRGSCCGRATWPTSTSLAASGWRSSRRAFHHLLTPEAQRTALGCIRRHLEPGGHLVIDLFDPKLEYCLPDGPVPPVREAREPAGGHLIRRRTTAREVDPLRQLITETVRFEIIDPAGIPVATEETSWRCAGSGGRRWLGFSSSPGSEWSSTTPISVAPRRPMVGSSSGLPAAGEPDPAGQRNSGCRRWSSSAGSSWKPR